MNAVEKSAARKLRSAEEELRDDFTSKTRKRIVQGCMETLGNMATFLEAERCGAYVVRTEHGSVMWVPKRVFDEVEDEMKKTISKERRDILSGLENRFRKVVREFWQHGIGMCAIDGECGKVTFVPAT